MGMMSLQIIAAMIPGEPLEIAAGYAFGAAEGTALCLLGALLGGTAVFLGVRRFGRLGGRGVFSTGENRRPAAPAKRTQAGGMAVRCVFVSGTPGDLLTYCAGLTHMRLGKWLAISVAGRIPSVLTSTIGGRRAGRGQLRLCRAGVWRDAPALRGGPGIPPHERPGKGRKEACPVL